MSGPRPRGGHSFPNWNYGYTLGPAAQSGNGDYTMMRPPFGPGFGGPGFGPGERMSFRGGGRGRGGFRGGGAKGDPKNAASDGTTPPADDKADQSEPKEGSAEGDDQTKTATPPDVIGEGAVSERPLAEILHGRNPVMFCNDQSKYRGLHMEWEQVSESGPPHDKTFCWSLKMGDMMVTGVANSKKGAKNKAAEEMAKKLDTLPKIQKRNFYQMNFRGCRGGMGPMRGGMFYNRMPPPPPWMQQQMYNKRRKMEQAAAAGATEAPPGEGGEGTPAGETPTPAPTPKVLNPSQNNPISKLYEFCKKKRHPEPVFETLAENVLETRKTQQGFTLKKTEFTMQCSILGKKFLGVAMTKKQAKFNAAAAAWADVGEGVAQESISNLLQSQRNATGAE